MLRYVWRELVRNPLRTLVSLVGVVLGTALFAGVLFFIDGSAATMTRRAIAPLPLDMQYEVTTTPGDRLRLTESIAAPEPPTGGEPVTVTLTVTNPGDHPQHEVVVKAEVPASLSYVADSTSRDGTPLPDRGGDPPLAHGPARLGLNLGTLPPGASVTLSYRARGDAAVAADGLPRSATVSSREHPLPLPANRPVSLGLQELTERIRRVDGVAAAEALSYVDVPPGALAANGQTLRNPIRVFAFESSYLTHHPSVRLEAGRFEPAAALLSVEAARALGVAPGGSVRLTLPGASESATLPVSGLVDLSSARALFWSRKTSTFENFLYVPNSVVVGHEMFQRIVVSAYLAASATLGSEVKSFPVSEVDIQIERTLLHADPGRALAQTSTIASRIRQIEPVEGNLIDNVSNTLEVARDDARVGKRMFLFIGFPGGLLAAFLAAYAGGVLSATQRRERAILRVRGAHRHHFLRMLLYRTVLFSTLGAVAGTVLGFASVAAILGLADLAAVSPAALSGSALLAIATGIAVTSWALLVPGLRSLRREIGEERRELGVAREPGWRRWWLDGVAVVTGAVGGVIALRLGAFDTRPTSVSIGQSTALPHYLLFAPLLVWLGGALLSARFVEVLARRGAVPRSPRYGPVVRGTLLRSLGRRSQPLATAAAGIALIVALGTNLTIFATTYRRATAADARFAVGSDLRLTPNVLTPHAYPPSTADALVVAGVTAVSPVVFQLENAVLVGRFDQNLQDLAAIEPRTFAQVASLSNAFFPDTSAVDAIASLGRDSYAVLVHSAAADDLSIEPGDDVEILLARGTDRQTLAPFHVTALFDRFPAFPEGVDLVVNLEDYQVATGLPQTDFFLAQVRDRTPDGLDRAISAIQNAPVTQYRFGIETSPTALLRDRSSLTALNVRGLTTLDLSFTTLMAGAVIAIFVFALVMQRRSEYATLHARGVQTAQLGALVFGEALTVAVAGTLAGLAIGTGMAQLFVFVLRPLFIVHPDPALDAGTLLLVAGVAPVTALIAALVATLLLGTRTVEMVRET